MLFDTGSTIIKKKHFHFFSNVVLGRREYFLTESTEESDGVSFKIFP